MNYVLRIATMSMLYMVLALGLRIVTGFIGYLDLGYVGFYAIGAYTSALLSAHYDIPYWMILLLAVSHGALWGILRGIPTLGLTGDYFAIVTFGFSELIVLIIRNEVWLTRGPMGITGVKGPSFLWHTLSKDWEFFYLILFMLVLATVVIRRLEHSRTGRAMIAIREDETAAEACGIDTRRYKMLAFALSASFGAAAGSFYAHWMHIVHPDMFHFWESILVLCIVIVGGMGSVSGVVVGALVLIPVTDILRVALLALARWSAQAGVTFISQDIVNARYLVFGVILILMMRFRSQGLKS
ncbi:MAG: branched-chain amino acid ABC transporter permease [Magnetococcales bacterium]|uniref:Branched-chain amino acid ABC transporter permease n=2 Tax=Candidatus Magnetobacterium casense TaxID=1455061 RepID=A0ABS6RWW6_9BACT|nr:branched-chain amino acid ABC transporter permease [Nitrospirota bacterium]MBV6341121.1 branched-chain amino acid ABC transporter permease [Candidatus Magnetobacterium casensis]